MFYINNFLWPLSTNVYCRFYWECVRMWNCTRTWDAGNLLAHVWIAMCNCIKLLFVKKYFSCIEKTLCLASSIENAWNCTKIWDAGNMLALVQIKVYKSKTYTQINKQTDNFIQKTFYDPYQPLCIAGSIENAWNCGIAQRLEMQATCSLMFE